MAHSESGELFSALKEKEISLPRKRVFSSKGKNFPVSCRHCKEPKCIDACPAAALSLDEARGVVVHNKERCVGCWMCVMACPYGAGATRPNLKSRLPLRCDKCEGRDEPGCIKSCPTGAVIWKEE